MTIQVLPLPVPPTADAAMLKDFGREVKGVNPGSLTPEQFKEVHDLLYKVLQRLPQGNQLTELQPISMVRCSSAMQTFLQSSSTL